MSPKKVIRILFICQLLICLSLLIFSDFYINEISKKYNTDQSKLTTHIYFILVSLGFALTNFNLFGSFLNNKGARLMLLANVIGSSIILITLILFFFTTPFRPPAFLLFFLLCISIICFIYYRKTNYDFLD